MTRRVEYLVLRVSKFPNNTFEKHGPGLMMDEQQLPLSVVDDHAALYSIRDRFANGIPPTDAARSLTAGVFVFYAPSRTV